MTIKMNDKFIGVVIGITLTLAALGAVNLVSVSSAHGNDMNNDMMHNGMMQMMMSDMMSDMTQEETNEMLKIMDKDNDGLCDHCGLRECREMMA